jgi:hypothetical protein
MSVDPLAEKYPGLSSYNFVANNPIIIVDPNGMDWYEHEETKAVMWQKGSEKIDGYKNIGSHYSHRQDNLTLNYNQNELESIEEHVLNKSDFKTSQTTPKIQCFTAAKQMAEKSGAEVLGGGAVNSIVTAYEENTTDGYNVKSKGTTAEAIAYINSQINQGKSVVVGVDYKKGHPGNDDSITDHFVAISSRLTNLKDGSVIYRFYDPGTSWQDKGTSDKNTFSLQSGMLAGTTFYKTTNNKYTISQIRKNK